MKKLLCIITLAIILLNVKAQISLEHSSTIGLGGAYNGYSNMMANKYMYFIGRVENIFTIYNLDYSVNKSFAVSPPSGYTIGESAYASINVFDKSGNIDVLIGFLDSGANTWTWEIFNEKGILVYNFGKYSGFSGIFIANSLLKITFFNVTPSKHDIYSLGGTASIKSVNSLGTVDPAYPNPSNTIINLPYKLKNGEKSVIFIYNSNGQLLEQKHIDYLFDKVLLNVSNYKPGIYLYKYNEITKSFVVY